MSDTFLNLLRAISEDSSEDVICSFTRDGLDLSFTDPETGQTALRHATICNKVRSLNALLKHGANPQQRFTYRSPVDGRAEAGRIALHYACSEQAAVSLIQAGSDVNATDDTGWTPLMCAAHHGHLRVIQTLLAAGAKPFKHLQSPPHQKPYSARDLAEEKRETFQIILKNDDTQKIRQRLQNYEEVIAVLRTAERDVIKL